MMVYPTLMRKHIHITKVFVNKILITYLEIVSEFSNSMSIS